MATDCKTEKALLYQSGLIFSNSPVGHCILSCGITFPRELCWNYSGSYNRNLISCQLLFGSKSHSGFFFFLLEISSITNKKSQWYTSYNQKSTKWRQLQYALSTELLFLSSLGQKHVLIKIRRGVWEPSHDWVDELLMHRIIIYNIRFISIVFAISVKCREKETSAKEYCFAASRVLLH